jgi:hypothetical protein
MTSVHFHPPVSIRFGRQPRNTRNITSAREAAECLMSDRWPVRNGPALEHAARALAELENGLVSAKEARGAFLEAAREAGILVR